MYAVFMDILQQLDWVTICVVEGEADNVIAGLADQHKCPVLSNDSDFFIFNLEHGFIQLKHYERGEFKIFEISCFMKQYNLREYQLCLLIPTLHGNDSIPHSTENRDFLKDISEISKFGTIDEFFVKHGLVKENYETARKFYCDLQIPSDICEKLNPLPRWIFSKFRQGLFAGNLLKVYCSNFHRLPEIVEDVERGSAWRISRPIRQFLFGFMGLSLDKPITEIVREVCEEVKPIHLENTIRDLCETGLQKSALQDLRSFGRCVEVSCQNGRRRQVEAPHCCYFLLV